jgi:hypothetical protein
VGPTPIPPTPRPPTSTPGPTAIPTQTAIPTSTLTQSVAPAETAAATPVVESLWISPALPAVLAEGARSAGIPPALDESLATIKLDVSETDGSLWIYSLVAPFPTLTDEVTLDDIRQVWNGSSSGPLAGRPLWMAESTLAAFTILWGEPTPGFVRSAGADRLIDAAWSDQPSWAIIPFEEIQPRWKVISVDGQSPIRKDFDVSAYPLKINFAFTPSTFHLSSFIFPLSNRDPAKLTTVILTGVTALVRATALTMDVKGITYPGEALRGIFREADILHISNEVPFYGGCPDPDPAQEGLKFCSATRYIGLLTDIGTDVVELSGDHFANYGKKAMVETMAIYKDANIPTYGGGMNLYEGRAPLLMENNGNKLMFIGCNIKDVYATATETNPGAVPCDFEYMTAQIRQYRAEGYLPIATFQYHEYPSPEVRPEQQQDFRRMADAGAVIVSGSQAHLPQVMEFYNGSFIHYGLGNLFFDQMGDVSKVSVNRLEFIDRHVFYDGRYLGVELITALLEDYARPRLMTPAERLKLLNNYFGLSGW